MHIVLIVPDLAGRNGWSRYALDLGKELNRQGHTITAYVAKKSGADWCTEHAILRHATSYQGSSLLRIIHAFLLRRALKKNQPDIVHFIAEPYALMLPLMGNNPWKTVMTIHGSYAVVPLLINTGSSSLFSKAYHLLDLVVSVSNFTKQHLQSRAPELFASAGLEQKITVLHNAIELQNIQADTTRAPTPPLQILSVSAIKRKKGYLQAIEAIATFRTKEKTDIRYNIVGDLTADPLFVTELKDRIHTLGLDGVVHLHGETDDSTLNDLYREADLFILPSLHDSDYFEGFGLVFLEANARGTPVIGPTTGGCPEAIKDGVSGYICNPEDTDAMAEKIADVLIHRKIARENCLAWAEAHDVRSSAVALATLYTR